MKMKTIEYDFDDWNELSKDLIHELGNEEALDDWIDMKWAAMLIHIRSQNKVGNRIIVKWCDKIALDIVLTPEDILK